MTLCIAAVTNTNDGEHIVGCCDWRIETASYGAETQLKFRFLGGSWCAMYGGNDLSHALELCDRYAAFLEGKRIAKGNLLEMLRVPPFEMRKALAENYTQMALAVSYDRFLDDGEKRLAISDDLRRQVEFGVEQAQIKAEMIIMGVVSGELVMGRYANGDVTIHEDFVSIGSGSFLADAFLYLRSQGSAASLAETIYCVYEAKRIGELAPGVGRSTHMFVMSLDRSKTRAIFTMIRTDEDFKTLDRQLKKFGPRPVRDVLLPPSTETIGVRLVPRSPQPTTPDLSQQQPSSETPAVPGEY